MQIDIKRFSLIIVTKKELPNEFEEHMNKLFYEILGYEVQLDILKNQKLHVNKNSLKMSWFFNEIN